MKVLLTKDVYKLGRAGDVKRVADGYGRNFLLPQGLAVLATPGALKQVDRIRSVASTKRAALNSEMSGVAEKLANAVVTFASKAGETGKLYGSITPQMVVDAINKKYSLSIDRHMVEIQPIRTLGEHKAHIRLTVDLNPDIKVIVHREGETVELAEETPAVVEETPAAPEAEAQE
ncbi:LSU ribosomal protein L9P [Longilinea arvoryzae]|uniref:Large ribosomal subunit protein bL9 n=1 Tax=Longilinea arvoryzae TaxID=360412 RepID=A0A0S7BI50_9CHLR|nr:50S ribosomal protein L9 [Longilinea arvoryzae]GAP14166.1 LSU ribosomal protein L9P [Longilinea arvoryzae]